jgi:hypothetical protein
MQDSKLVKNISDLPQKDRERFRQFVISPFFNQHKPTLELLDHLLKTIDKAKPDFNRESIFKKIYPKENAYDEQKLHNVMSNLKKLYHRFLAIDQFEKEPLLEELYTLASASDRNQFELMINRAKLLDRQFEELPAREDNYNFLQYHKHRLLGYYEANYVDRTNTDPLQKMLDYLDKFYLIEKLRNCCHLTANMMLMNTQYDFGLLESVLPAVAERSQEEPSNKEDWPIVMYHRVLLTMRFEDDSQHYQNLTALFGEAFTHLNPLQQKDLFSFACNYCIRRSNLGDVTYKKELFELYKKGLNLGLMLENGIISEFTYKNIATLGCNLREFEWTEQFLQQYRNKLLPNKRDNAYHLNLATVYYNKRQYREVLSSLLRVQFTDVVYHLNSNFLLLRSYYALKDTEALLSLIETFRIYVMRSRKMTASQRRAYTNFLRFAKKLVELRHNGFTMSKEVLNKKLQELHAKVKESDNVVNREWLLEESKVEED